MHLGGGRQKTSDTIDFAVGFVMNKKLGDKITKGESLLTIHYHKHQLATVEQIALEIQKSNIKIAATKPRTKKKLILEIETKFAPKTKKKK